MHKFTEQEIKRAHDSDLVHVVRGYGVELTQRGRDHLGVCPFHNDKTPSLVVTPGKGWYCHPCKEGGGPIDFVMKFINEADDNKRFVAAVDLLLGNSPARFSPPPQSVAARVDEPDEWERVTDLALAPPPPDPWKKCHGKPFTDRHKFRDAGGTLTAFVDRFKDDEGKVTIPWTCWLNRKTGELEWRRKGFSDPRPLYGWDELARYKKAMVVIVEGERTADKARQHFIDAGVPLAKLVVASWHGGTNVIDQIDLSPLYDRSVLMWPDNDEPGVAAMLDIFARLDSRARKVRLAMPPENAPVKWDLADTFPEGFDLRGHLENKDNIIVTEKLRLMLAAVNATPAPATPKLVVDNTRGGDFIGEANQQLDELRAANDPAKQSGLNLGTKRYIDAIGAMKANDFLIDGILDRDTMACIYSPPGHAKTFIALSMGIAVATGTQWFGHDVEQGAVFYMCGEGQNGILRRIRAHEIHHDMNIGDAPLCLTESAAPLADRTTARQVADDFRALSEKHGLIPELIIVDTLARNFGADENSTEDMNRFIANLDELRREWRCTVLVIHHSGKDVTRGGRGSTALKGALDSEFEVERGDDGVIRMHNRKTKDIELPAPVAFTLHGVEIPGLIDKKGRPGRSASLVKCDYTVAPKQGVPDGGKNQKIFMQALQAMEIESRERLDREGYTSNVVRVTLKELRERTGLEYKPFWKVQKGYEVAGKIVVDGPHVRTSGMFA